MENEEEFERCIICGIEDEEGNMIYVDGCWHCKKCYYGKEE